MVGLTGSRWTNALSPERRELLEIPRERGDLTVEALVVDTGRVYHLLFDADVVAAAAERLAAARERLAEGEPVAS